MAGFAEPEQVAARHELGAKLRQLREQAGLSGQGLADLLGWSQSKVSRIEQARTLPSLDDVRTALAGLRASESTSARLLELATVATSGSWRNSTGVGLTRRQQDFVALEASAAEIYHYNPVILPGYMQTEEYARSVIRMAGAANEERAVEHRMARRSTMLRGDGPQYRVTLPEAVLRWRPVPVDQMAEQLRKLAEYAALPNVELRIISLDRKQSSFMQHPLMVFRYTSPDTLKALVETTTQDHHITETGPTAQLLRNFEQLTSSALSLDDSLALLRKVIDTFADAS
ncbi:helix-turn-helix domain-containing protein [Micromonospora sp. NPDC049051]|uniref:helix-turn-helix domain-containing protein n=1 Tax=Micromonospora sp. NPDC049051 TaxID=3364264 RepID=UPI00371F40DF